MGGLTPSKADEERYAEGNREPRNCRCCKQPVWIVYHGPLRNHTIEPRIGPHRTRLESEVSLYRAALEAILAPHGQDVSDRIRDIAESALNGGEISVES